LENVKLNWLEYIQRHMQCKLRKDEVQCKKGEFPVCWYEHQAMEDEVNTDEVISVVLPGYVLAGVL
jgi:hypothetical protein